MHRHVIMFWAQISNFSCPNKASSPSYTPLVQTAILDSWPEKVRVPKLDDFPEEDYVLVLPCAHIDFINYQKNLHT